MPQRGKVSRANMPGRVLPSLSTTAHARPFLFRSPHETIEKQSDSAHRGAALARDHHLIITEVSLGS
jgi:hypothetical protein